MTIKTQITETRLVDKEIALPYYCKYNLLDYYYKIVDENTVISVTNSYGYSSVTVSNISNDFLAKISEHPEISAEVFNEAARKAFYRTRDVLFAESTIETI